MIRYCCHLPCLNEAKFTIWFQPQTCPDDWTDACENHVEELKMSKDDVVTEVA